MFLKENPNVRTFDEQFIQNFVVSELEMTRAFIFRLLISFPDFPRNWKTIKTNAT
jgi:hypothetical protein